VAYERSPPADGTQGPIQTSSPVYVDEIAPYFVEACARSGIRITKDFNAPAGREGVGYYHFNIRGGVRDSAAKAFLSPVMGRR
jgi:choline dehydrogenase